jgi:hypothetical protein
VLLEESQDHGLRPPDRERQDGQDHRKRPFGPLLRVGVVSGRINLCDFENWGGRDSHSIAFTLGGSDRDIKVKGWPNVSWMGLDWSADGKGLYVGSVAPQSRTLLYVDLKGNAQVLWQDKRALSQIWGIPSPDGRYIAIRGGVTNSNVWMLEGF